MLYEVKKYIMSNDDSISFSSLLAGLLLLNKVVTSGEIINKISFLEDKGIYVDDEDDDISYLECCVDFDHYRVFSLKKGYDYDSILGDDISVFDFLMSVAGDKVLKLLKGDHNTYHFILENNNQLSLFDSFRDKSVGFAIDKKIKLKKRSLLPYFCNFNNI